MLLENNSMERLFENEKVESVLNKISDGALNCFKVIVFDIAPKRDRNPDVLRSKLSKVSNSKTVKELTSNLLDLSEDNEVSDPVYADVKNLYYKTLEYFCKAMNRAAEINKTNSETILKKFKNDPMKLQGSVDLIAKQAQEEQDNLNESLFSGYRDRVNNVKKLLTNLISSAKGKDQKSGYGKDWERAFIELDQIRKTLDNNKGEVGEKNKRNLEDLEKRVEKYHTDFNNAMINASNRSLQALEDDEEAGSTYGDINDLVTQALDYLTRAKAQYTIALKEINDKHIVKDDDIGKGLFPIKRYDKDSQKKFKGSRLIFNIQTALCNAFPAAKKVINANNGPSGNYGSATQSVIATVQKLSGNKNANGEIDKVLLANMLSSDWMSKEDRDSIQKSLDVIRNKSKVNESFQLIDDVYTIRFVNEEKISINKSDFEKELKDQYKTITGKTELDQKAVSDQDDQSKGDNPAGAYSLAKKLRNKYNLKVEKETFIKGDDTLKSSYNEDFITAWNKALDKADPAEDYSYFFFDEGLYNINLSSSSLKSPCNWKKWANARQLRTLDNEDSVSFVENYMKGWKSFGMINAEGRYEAIKQLIKIHNEDDEKDLSGAYEMMEASIGNRSIPYIDFEVLKDDIKSAIEMVIQSDESSIDLGPSEFIALNNFLIMIANAITFDGDKFISCIKWVHDNVIGEETSNRISKDSISLFGEKENREDPFLTFEGNTMTVTKIKDLEKRRVKDSNKETSKSLIGFKPLIKMGDSTTNSIKKMLGKNLYYIAADIYPGVSTHLKRINATTFEDIPDVKPFKCVNIEEV
jgi:hypothetical protein